MFRIRRHCINLIKVRLQHIVSCLVLQVRFDHTTVSEPRVSAPNSYEYSIGSDQYQIHKLFSRCHV